MDFEIKAAANEDVGIVGDMFAAHLDEQFSIDPYAAPNKAFDPRWFIEAMMNPPVNMIFIAVQNGEIIGFARLGVLYGEGLIPLASGVRRTESSYLKRIPVIILGKLRGILDRMIAKFETRRTIGNMAMPTKRGYIADMYVISEMRRKGVGKALLDASMKWFSSVGLTMVDLQYLWENEAGKNFWESNGFANYRVTARKTAGS